MAQELALQLGVPETFDEVQRFAKVFAESGLFTDVKGIAGAAVKIIAGRELGIPAFSSMNGIHIIQGKTTLAAQLMATLIKRSCKYNYRVVEHTEAKCVIDFLENGERCGTATFTMEEAAQAGLLGKTGDMYKKYPKNMLFSRAMSNGAKWYCADVFGGPVYTPEEMGAVVDEQGDPIRQAESRQPETRQGGTAIEAAPQPPEENTNRPITFYAESEPLVKSLAAFGLDINKLSVAQQYQYLDRIGSVKVTAFEHVTSAQWQDFAKPLIAFLTLAATKGLDHDKKSAEAIAETVLGKKTNFVAITRTDWRKLCDHLKKIPDPPSAVETASAASAVAEKDPFEDDAETTSAAKAAIDAVNDNRAQAAKEAAVP